VRNWHQTHQSSGLPRPSVWDQGEFSVLGGVASPKAGTAIDGPVPTGEGMGIVPGAAWEPRGPTVGLVGGRSRRNGTQWRSAADGLRIRCWPSLLVSDRLGCVACRLWGDWPKRRFLS